MGEWRNVDGRQMHKLNSAMIKVMKAIKQSEVIVTGQLLQQGGQRGPL